MSWWNEVANRFFGVGSRAPGLSPGITGMQDPNSQPAPDAFASVFPLWEQTTPQYPLPQPWNLARDGYNKNEIVYACIQKRAVSVAEPALLFYDDLPNNSSRSELPDHPARDLLSRPNPMMGEVEFWQATEIMTCTAGFAAWEIEMDNRGRPIGLWPMRPHWCSFLAANGKPVAYVRYQPDGLPVIDVPIERVLLFSEFNPLYPQIRPLSKTAVALRVIAADNSATDFVTKFFQRGAVTSGLLKVQQTLTDATAENIRRQWREQHGGVENWTDVAVLGSGVDFQQTQMSFRDMDFTNIDGRNEARVCAVMGVPPILINAKVGLAASTYSNFEQARKAFYEETISPRWQWLESVIDSQLLPKYSTSAQTYPGFDLTEIKALQEDRTAKWTRAVTAATANIITRDEARSEMGLSRIDNTEVFIGQYPPAVGEETISAEDQAKADAENQKILDDAVAQEIAEQPPAQPADAQPAADNAQPEQSDAPMEMMKSPDQVKAMFTEWRKAAIESVKLGIPMSRNDACPDINAALAECKSASDVRRVFDEHWPHDEDDAEAKAKRKGVGISPDDEERRKSEKAIQAAMTAYFASFITRLEKELA